MQVDYAIAQEKGKTLTILTAMSNKNGQSASTVVEHKGMTSSQYPAAWLTMYLKSLGYEKLIVLVDPESAIGAVARVAVRTLANGSEIKTSPRASKESMGMVGRYQQTLHSQVRAILLMHSLCFQSKSAYAINDANPPRPWIAATT